MQYIPACAQAVETAVSRAMKRLFILPVLLFLTIPYAQGQELYGVNRFDLQVSGLGGVKNNVPEIPATDVYPYPDSPVRSLHILRAGKTGAIRA